MLQPMRTVKFAMGKMLDPSPRKREISPRERCRPWTQPASPQHQRLRSWVSTDRKKATGRVALRRFPCLSPRCDRQGPRGRAGESDFVIVDAGRCLGHGDGSRQGEAQGNHRDPGQGIGVQLGAQVERALYLSNVSHPVREGCTWRQGNAHDHRNGTAHFVAKDHLQKSRTFGRGRLWYGQIEVQRALAGIHGSSERAEERSFRAREHRGRRRFDAHAGCGRGERQCGSVAEPLAPRLTSPRAVGRPWFDSSVQRTNAGAGDAGSASSKARSTRRVASADP